MVYLMCMFLLIITGVRPEVMALIERLGFSFRYCLLYAQIVFLRLPVGFSILLRFHELGIY